MPQLLLELLSEEIPARMQANAARDLERMVRERLAAEGLLPEALKTFAGARRLTLVAEGLPEAQKDRHEELKGPRTNAPEQALEGFLRKTGLAKSDLAEKDGVWFAHLHRKGRPTPEIVAELVQGIVREFPWPKSMVSGTSKLRWVRPLRRILCVFDGEIVPFEIDGIPSGDTTQGHRFMGSGQPFKVKDFDAYAEKLEKHFVVLDVEERKARIVEAAKTLCFARNLELVEDPGLLDEVAGLVEWPIPVLGDMDPAFLDLPPEVIRTSMRVHQRYFAVRDPKTGKLAPHFVTVANIDATDGGRTIALGNAKVLSARLSDARFFWNEDRRTRLEDRLEKLKGVTFHAKLGAMYERVERVTELAEELAPAVGADPRLAMQAARLAKADLVSGVVGEFPELQGIMGGYYAAEEGLDPQVINAIREHYKPVGPNDAVPVDAVAATVALADKLDALVGFFLIGEKATGSRDPFGLRRAALGVIRILIATQTRLSLRSAITLAARRCALVFDYAFAEDQGHFLGAAGPYSTRMIDYLDLVETNLANSPWLHVFERRLGLRQLRAGLLSGEIISKYSDARLGLFTQEATGLFNTMRSIKEANPYGPHEQEDWRAFEREQAEAFEWVDEEFAPIVSELLAFFADRLKVQLRDEGQRPDLVDAVFALGDDDLVRIVARVTALDAFLATDDGRNLLAGYKRAVNILKAEEKKGPLPIGPPLSRAGAPAEEEALLGAVMRATGPIKAFLAREDFAGAMRALAALRTPVDAFFDKVLVNSAVSEERDNRLRLLAKVRDAMGQVADFAQVTG